MSYRLHPTKNKGVTGSGPKWWIITISQGAKAKQLTFSWFGDEAGVIAEDARLKKMLGNQRAAIEPTIAESLPDYVTHYRTIATPAIVTDMLSCMRRCLLPAFGKLMPKQIVGPLVSSYTLKRLETGVTHRTVQKELNYLSAMVKWMKAQGFASEIREIQRPPQAKCKPKKVIHPLTIEELSNFLDQLPPDRQAMALLMCDAGLRVTEALTMRCEDIDLPGGRVVVRGKGNKQLLYPILTRRLFDALKREKKERYSGWLVVNPETTTPYKSLKTLFRLAACRANIQKPVTHHVLRHTYSVLLMQLEIPSEVRQRLMRHSTLAATEHYTHVSPEWLEGQAGRFSELIDRFEAAAEGVSETMKEKNDKKINNYLWLVK